MKLIINGKIKEFEDNITLRALVDQLATKPDRTIAELNGRIIEVLKWDELRLEEGDKLELVSFVGGG